jgi:K+-transporting ATPase c subunit
VAAERGLPLARVLELIDDASSRPLLGLGGPKSVNVVELNDALEAQR